MCKVAPAPSRSGKQDLPIHRRSCRDTDAHTFLEAADVEFPGCMCTSRCSRQKHRWHNPALRFNALTKMRICRRRTHARCAPGGCYYDPRLCCPRADTSSSALTLGYTAFGLDSKTDSESGKRWKGCGWEDELCEVHDLGAFAGRLTMPHSREELHGTQTPLVVVVVVGGGGCSVPGLHVHIEVFASKTLMTQSGSTL